MNILETPILSNTRRNHALEHATINLLTKKYPGERIIGHSDHGGFWLHTKLSTEDVADAATEALERLKSGDSELAYHQNCGTNFAVSGIAAGLGAFVGMWRVGNRFRDKLMRLPTVALFATLALMLTNPFKKQIQQKVTTDPIPSNLHITQVTRTMIGNKPAIRVTTKG